MFNFVVNNLSSIFVGSLVAVVLVSVIVKMIKDKKKGKCSCGCQCANCPNGAGQHKCAHETVKKSTQAVLE